MDVAKRFAQNLIEQREKRGMTPAELAESAAIAPEHLEAIENGAEQPMLEEVAKLAGGLGVPVADLTDGLD
jgi:transcriptional regulator with XRE-family HTH domain